MDFKGITWAGNIYQKFEAMCLEVEEVMYEDTVKYVENQVQKVGVSVKKFYSEVMQDLVPPSCVDPVKVTVGDLSTKTYTHTDTIKKPKLRETQVEDISDLTAKESSLNVTNDVIHLHPLPPRVIVENTRSEFCSTRSKKLGVYKRPIGIKRLSQKTSSLSNNCAVRHSPGEAVNDNTPSSDASVKSLASDKVLSAEFVRQVKSDSECNSAASDKILSAESVGGKKKDSDDNSSCLGLSTEPIGVSMKGISFSMSSSSSRSNACDVEPVGQDVMTSYEDKFRQNGYFSQTNSNIGSDTCDVESVDGEVIQSYEDNFDMEIIENEEVVEPRQENFKTEKSKLDETCILVEEDMLHFASQGTQKHKSYKKKIREALSSKLRSTRKQDQSVSHCKDLGAENNAGVVVSALTIDSDKRKLPSNDSFESEWELL